MKNTDSSERCCGQGCNTDPAHRQFASQADELGCAIDSTFRNLCDALAEQARQATNDGFRLTMYGGYAGMLVLGERFLAFRLTLGDVAAVPCTPQTRYPGVHSHARRAVSTFSVELFAGLLSGVQWPPNAMTSRHRFLSATGILDGDQMRWRCLCPPAAGSTVSSGAAAAIELPTQKLAQQAVALVLSTATCPPDMDSVRKVLQQ